MNSTKVREIPNDHSAIYFKEIPAQLAEIKESLMRVTGSGLPGMTYKTLRDEFAIAVMAAMLAGYPAGIEQADQMAAKAYRWADAMLEARESISMASTIRTTNS